VGNPTVNKIKILCVDDETSVVEALRRLLRVDFEVLVATSGPQALQLLEGHRDVGVILSDQYMQGMSGIDLLQRSRTLVPHAVRAILSGQIELRQISEALNRGDIHRLILKPWDNDYLRIQIQEAVATHGTLLEKSRLRQLAITDPVTGLTNHRFFQERLQELWHRDVAKAVPLALLMVDIDNFKAVNDEHDHLAGDQVLSEVATRLSSCIHEGETVSRYGGEEFAILLPHTDMTKARPRAEAIREAVANVHFAIPEGRPIRLTVSVGLATATSHSDCKRPSDLISAADRALYQAKKQGRNQVIVADPTLDRN
jgi:diguanylate cyclase (GGDEF)-like protein